jgi:hypothetical protein
LDYRPLRGKQLKEKAKESNENNKNKNKKTKTHFFTLAKERETEKNSITQYFLFRHIKSGFKAEGKH